MAGCDTFAVLFALFSFSLCVSVCEDLIQLLGTGVKDAVGK